MDDPEILTLKEAAALVRYSDSHLRRLCHAGATPYRQQGNGKITIKKSALMSWWENFASEDTQSKIQKFRILSR